MKFRILPLIALAGLITFSSCEKEESDPEPTMSEKLTGNNWSLSAYNVEPAIDADGDGTQENNLMPYLGACNLDDFWNFVASGAYTFEEGASKCDPNDPQIIESGTWLWNSDNTRLVINSGGQTMDAKIIRLNSNEMIWEFTQVNAGVTYTFTQTLN